jgi:hypothetical protein
LHVDAFPDTLRDDAEVFEHAQTAFHAFLILLIERICFDVDSDVLNSPTTSFVPSQFSVYLG